MYSFEDNGDYVYDVQWSPIHPALFAAVDGTGRLDLWNLNHDTEVQVSLTPLLNLLVTVLFMRFNFIFLWTGSNCQHKFWINDLTEPIAVDTFRSPDLCGWWWWSRVYLWRRRGKYSVVRELKQATFLSHGRQAEVSSFPNQLVFTLPRLFFKSLY